MRPLKSEKPGFGERRFGEDQTDVATLDFVL